MRNISSRGTFFCLLPLVVFGLWGCDRSSATDRVVVYTSVDQQFARRILGEFEARTGIDVVPLFDTEAGKTTGFLRRLEREKQAPRADVWWSSEVFGTINLAKNGVFAPYDSHAAADIPDDWKDRRHYWTGLAARARVVAFRPDRVDEQQLPETWAGYADPAWAEGVAIANPQFGTTRGHVAAMFAYWGNDNATQFLRDLAQAGAAIADGNAHTVRLVDSGAVRVGFTDTDDVWVARRNGRPINLHYPKLADNLPIVWIPNTVARVRGGPNPDAARKLIDFLVSREMERTLAESDSRNVPVRPALREATGYDGPEPAPLDYQRIAAALPKALEVAENILLR